MCFYTKRAKKKDVKGFFELACTAMYTMCACGEQAGFVFMPSPSCTRLSCWAQMFHTNTNLLSFCSVVVLLGLRSLHSLQVCRVCKFVLLWVSFCFVLLFHRTCRMILREAKTETKSQEKQRRKRYTGLHMVRWMQEQATKIQCVKNTIINQINFQIRLQMFFCFERIWIQGFGVKVKVIGWWHWSGMLLTK